MASFIHLLYCLERRFHFFCFHLLQNLGYDIGGIGFEELLEVGGGAVVGHGGVAQHGIEEVHLGDGGHLIAFLTPADDGLQFVYECPLGNYTVDPR